MQLLLSYIRRKRFEASLAWGGTGKKTDNTNGAKRITHVHQLAALGFKVRK